MPRRRTKRTKQPPKTIHSRRIVVLLFFLFAVMFVYRYVSQQRSSGRTPAPTLQPSAFKTTITNTYMRLSPGTIYRYQEETPDGPEEITISITGETKEIMGIQTLVYHDVVLRDGEMIEDTRDYLAQDMDGTVWYFGEDVDNYENGKFIDHEGSWRAGENGARPGVWMKADPEVGEEYYMEYSPGVAEDQARVVSTDETVTVPYGTYTHCVKIYEWTDLDPEAQEYKYHCPEVGTVVLTEHLIESTRGELVDIDVSK